MKTLLSGKSAGPPLDVSPLGIGRAGASQLRAKAMNGDEDAAWALVRLGVYVCDQIEYLFNDTEGEGRKVLIEASKKFTQFPVLHPDTKWTDTPSSGETMLKELPIGEYQGKVRGGIIDVLGMELRLWWVPHFNELRSEGAKSEKAAIEAARSQDLAPLVERACALHKLSMETTREWAKLIADWMEAEDRPMFNPNTWLYKVASPESRLSQRQVKARGRIKDKRDVAWSEGIVAQKMKEIDQWKVTDGDVRTGLYETINNRLESMFGKRRPKS